MLCLSLVLHALVLLYLVGDASARWGAQKYFFKVGPSCYAYKVKENFLFKFFGEMNYSFQTTCRKNGFSDIFRKSRTMFQLIDVEEEDKKNKELKQVIIPRKLRNNLLVGLAIIEEEEDKDIYKLQASTKKENIAYPLLYDEVAKRCYIKKDGKKIVLIPSTVGNKKSITLEAYVGKKNAYQGRDLTFEKVPSFWSLNQKQIGLETDEAITQEKAKAVEELTTEYKKYYTTICQTMNADEIKGFTKEQYIKRVIEDLEAEEELSNQLLKKELEKAEKYFTAMDVNGDKRINEEEFVKALLEA